MKTRPTGVIPPRWRDWERWAVKSKRQSNSETLLRFTRGSHLLLSCYARAPLA